MYIGLRNLTNLIAQICVPDCNFCKKMIFQTTGTFYIRKGLDNKIHVMTWKYN